MYILVFKGVFVVSNQKWIWTKLKNKKFEILKLKYI